MMEKDPFLLSWKLLGSGIVGAVTFPAVLATTQLAVFKPLRITFQSGPTSSLAGLASVTVASFGASLAALQTISLIQQHLPEPGKKLSVTYRHLFLSTVSGVLVFRALGGRFERVLPSNLMRPGAFAADWIPALKEADYATAREREVIQKLGKKHGCHSCGTRGGEKFIADHQPPSKLIGNHQSTPSVPNSLMQRFYPQCKQCSAKQGGLLTGKNVSNAAMRVEAVRTHGSSLRPHHMFVPVPFLTVYLINTGRESTRASGAPNSQVKEAETAKSSPELQTVLMSPKREREVARSPRESQVVATESGEENAPLHTWMDIDRPLSFPLLIVWQKVVKVLDSFRNPLTSFHVTVWAFTIVAALGTI